MFIDSRNNEQSEQNQPENKSQQLPDTTLTPDQIKSLRQLKEERQKYVEEQEQLQKQADALHNELLQLQLEAAVEREFDAFSRSTGAKFYGRTCDIFKLLSESFDIKQSEDGSSVALQRKGSSDPIAFGDALETFAVDHPYWCSTLGVLRPEAERVRCRDDFKSNAEKVAWIKKHSLQEFERLPQHKLESVSITEITAEQFRRLPVSQKAELAGKYGPDGIAAIMRRR